MSEPALKLASNVTGSTDTLPEGWEWKLYKVPESLSEKVEFLKLTRGVPKLVCAEGVWMASPT